MKTRSELVTEFRDWIDQPHTAIVGSTYANREINRAYKQLIGVINEWNYRFYFTTASISTTASTAYVAVPTASVMINKIVDSDGYTLAHRDIERFNLSLDNGEPDAWDTAGRRIYFTPTPDAIYTYTCYHTYMPVDFAGDSSTPEFVPGYEGLIAIKAALNSKLIRDEQLQELAAVEYAEGMKSLRHVVMTQQTASGFRVIPSEADLGD